MVTTRTRPDATSSWIVKRRDAAIASRVYTYPQPRLAVRRPPEATQWAGQSSMQGTRTFNEGETA